MASFNRVIILGNVTREIELRYTPAQTAVCDLGLAVNERVKRNDEWTDECTFVDVTLWGRTAEVAGEYLKKGSPVLIEGRLKQDSWTDKESGQKRSKLKVVGEKLQLLGGKRAPESQERTETADEYNQDPPEQAVPATTDDSIPF